jgi:hypothetical protein
MAILTTLSPEDLIPADHPIRRIRAVLDAVLVELDDEFAAMYASTGRPSVPPEQLLKATVLMAMYSISSELYQGVLRTVELRLVVQVVPGPPDRREGVRRDDVLEEPPAPVGSRDRGPVLRGGCRPSEASSLRLE